MKKRKNNLDEMQEMKLLHIEHTAFWLCFWGMLVSIYLQCAMGNGDLRSIGGESLVLVISAIYVLVSCIQNGIWDRKLKPDGKTNLILSGIAGLVVGGFWFVVSYYRYHHIVGSLVTFLMMSIFTAVLTMLLLTMTAAVYRRKKRKLEQKADQEEREE